MDSHELNLCKCSLSDVNFNVVFVLLVSYLGIKKEEKTVKQRMFCSKRGLSVYF